MTRSVRANGPALGVAILLALGLKLAYSRLGPDQLTWMTGPTQALVGLLTGIDFVYETGYGYVSLAHRIVIAKSCTGVNYLLAVFGMLAFTLIPAIPRQRRKLLMLDALAFVSYAVAVLVNALRIALGIALHEAGACWGWFTPGRVHRAAGIVIYFLTLVAIHALARHALLQREVHGRERACLVRAPLLWYGLVAVGVPFLNGAFFARPRLFAEHAAWVMVITLTLAAAARFFGVRRSLRLGGHSGRFQQRESGSRSEERPRSLPLEATVSR